MQGKTVVVTGATGGIGLVTARRLAELGANVHIVARNPTRIARTLELLRDRGPEGAHTAFLWKKLPYGLRGDARNWDHEKDVHARRMIRKWAGYAPNLEESLLGYFTGSPLDTERTLVNMRGGDLLVGALSGGQSGYGRPFEGAGEYRGYVKGLYLCGGSSHPGGNITGLPGYNCARTVMGDLQN